MRSKREAKAKPASLLGSLPLSRMKASFSRCVRDVQATGRAITITQHGRAAAVLAPVHGVSRPPLAIREPIDRRPLGALQLRPPKGDAAKPAAILRALDDERGE